MSAPIDVLAEWANDTTCPLDEANRRAETYAAVAALIEAAGRALPELAGKTYATGDDMGAHEALRAALARVGGAL